ncbi:MAG: D-alanyl-D-alanine endopeptidase [Ramlibacter sp.]|jgi:D-alanyl-D-alanine endopeptidase (penicillin-binding protein 7)|uniref:D-alanyl-D-alanine carboxypeptidase family protein n=1 Tax=Ramlibacter sp. TaxID=1917967 RepID=UPI00260B6AE9|nr:serine hydrolase [Ramlibacter sp.]MDB5750918.1 D-alanyl-D-alanine endopeptidase [Ramlibacter sp.]
MRSNKKTNTRTPALAVGLIAAAALGAGAWRAVDHGAVATRALPPVPAQTAPAATVANPPLPQQPPAGTESSAEAAASVPLEGAEPTEDVAGEARRNPISFARQAGLHRAKDPLRLASSAAVVMDPASGNVLYAKNESAVLPIASLTKLMTALIVTEGKLPMDEMLTITDEDVDRERNSRSRLRVGTTLTRGEALHLALMSSENRAAHALGRTFPGGLSQFVQAMNNRARLLGMRDTTFVDPTGLSNRNQSTARDVATLTSTAAKNRLLRDYSTTPQHQVVLGGRKLQYLNSNRLVRNAAWDIELQKTGYIVEAGQCVAMFTKVGGDEVVMVLLDASDKGSRSADAQRLKRWVSARDGDPQALAAARLPAAGS